MYVTMKQLHKISEELDIDIIENSTPDNYGEVGYDLRVHKILTPTKNADSPSELDIYTMAPGSTVFISTVEDLNLPKNMLGFVVQRNKLIRSGLRVEAPVYQPGHHTKLFLRVTNISLDDIKITTEDSIASIMFQQLSEDVKEYSGTYVNEFNYRGVGNYSDDIPQVLVVDNKIKSIETIEKTIYEKVITLLTIFVGVFSLINFNINFIEKNTIKDMLIYNLISIGGIGVLVGFVGIILNNKNKSNKFILIISLALILVAFLCV